MRILITAKPRAKENKIEKLDETHFNVFVKAPPIKGLANQAILELLADYFEISKNRVKIIMGATSKNKVIEII